MGFAKKNNSCKKSEGFCNGGKENAMKKKTGNVKKIVLSLIVASMILSVQEIPVLAETETKTADVQEESGRPSPSNPVHHCTGLNDGTDTTDWSYVYFGSYPQEEVLKEELTEDIAAASYDANGDAWVDGTKYRRISKRDTNHGDYFGDETYRYFKWKRIKWRVLKNDGNELFVMADQGLDCKNYNDTKDSVTWENCTLRNWLNSDFYNTAFSGNEQDAIVEQTVVNEDNHFYNVNGGNNTRDKVFLFSISEMMNSGYGFCGNDKTRSVSRQVKASNYAYARGADVYSDVHLGGDPKGVWWLRTPGFGQEGASGVSYFGNVLWGGAEVNCPSYAIVPGLYINMSSKFWYTSDDGSSGEAGGETGNEKAVVSHFQIEAFKDAYMGKETIISGTLDFSDDAAASEAVLEEEISAVKWESSAPEIISSAEIGCSGILETDKRSAALQMAVVPKKTGTVIVRGTTSNGLTASCEITVRKPEGTGGNDGTLPLNPVHHCTKRDDGTDATEWSYVYFGSYPQTEVTRRELTEAVTGASYNADGDAWVNGAKYRRISKKDVNDEAYFGNESYRYFKWEKIRWRVMKNDGHTLFVVADQGLDCKDYNEEYTSVIWENCTLRDWLNHDFYDMAFSQSEQSAVVEQTVANERNPYFGTGGGNDTKDKVFLLSFSEALNPEYGFCEDYSIYSVSRRMMASDYARIRGACSYGDSVTNGKASCYWWLRTSGGGTDSAALVIYCGYLQRRGVFVNTHNNACVPALHINLSSDSWSLEDSGTNPDPGAGIQKPAAGNDSGVQTETEKNPEKIILKPTSVNGRLKAKSKGFLVSWKKRKSVTGYQIQYSVSRKFTKKTTKLKNVKGASKTKLTVKKLKARKKYYVRVRTYKIVKGTTHYSEWSKSKSVTTKR